MLTEDSKSDFDPTKKVKYVDAQGFSVAGEGEQHLLKSAVELSRERGRVDRETKIYADKK